MAEFELGHKEIMEANNLNQSDLPKEIEIKILSLTMLIGSYDSTPSEELKDEIEHQSAKIGHEILDYLEKDLPEEPTLHNQSQHQQQEFGGNVGHQGAETGKQENTEKRSSKGLFNFFRL